MSKLQGKELMNILKYGDNGVHDYFGNKHLLILRNHGEIHWSAMKIDQGSFSLIGDNKANEINRNKADYSQYATFTCLGANTALELAKKIEKQEDMIIKLTGGKGIKSNVLHKN